MSTMAAMLIGVVWEARGGSASVASEGSSVMLLRGSRGVPDWLSGLKDSGCMVVQFLTLSSFKTSDVRFRAMLQEWPPTISSL